MSVDFNALEKEYFYFDKPVPYVLDEEHTLLITPIMVMDSEIFLSSLPIISFDKDNVPDPRIIQMSYLQFIVEVLFQKKSNIQALINLCKLCLGIDKLGLYQNEMKRYFLVDQDTGAKISQKQFDEIRRIILKQNIADYDDEYINPELKKALNETKELKNKYIDIPTIERKIAIITSHCGLPKREQLKMTYRSHNLLFQEVCGEVEYTTITPAVLFAGKKGEIKHWIFKKKKGKFDDGVISVADYNKSIGGNGETVQAQNGELSNQVNTLLTKLN